MSGSLAPSDVNSTSLPAASSSRAADDAEVGTQKGPSQEEEVPGALQGNLPDSGHKGDQTPKGSKSGPGPDSVPEPSVAPESGRRPLHKKGGTATPVTSVQPEAPDNLLEASSTRSATLL